MEITIKIKNVDENIISKEGQKKLIKDYLEDKSFLRLVQKVSRIISPNDGVEIKKAKQIAFCLIADQMDERTRLFHLADMYDNIVDFTWSIQDILQTLQASNEDLYKINFNEYLTSIFENIEKVEKLSSKESENIFKYWERERQFFDAAYSDSFVIEVYKSDNDFYVFHRDYDGFLIGTGLKFVMKN